MIAIWIILWSACNSIGRLQRNKGSQLVWIVQLFIPNNSSFIDHLAIVQALIHPGSSYPIEFDSMMSSLNHHHKAIKHYFAKPNRNLDLFFRFRLILLILLLLLFSFILSAEYPGSFAISTLFPCVWCSFFFESGLRTTRVIMSRPSF